MYSLPFLCAPLFSWPAFTPRCLRCLLRMRCINELPLEPYTCDSEFENASKISQLCYSGVTKVEPSLTYRVVHRFIQKFEGTSSALRKRFRNRSFQVHHAEICNEIVRCYKNNSSTTAKDIANRLKARGIFASLTQIKRHRSRLGFKRTTTKYCHTIRQTNKAARLEFCTVMLREGTTFSDCVFTDECTIQIDCSTKFCYIRDGDEHSKLRQRAKHPAKIHIWGGISARGATHLAIIPGDKKIDSEMYCQILQQCYLPFRKSIYNGFCRLVQDNAPPHKSKYTADKLKEWGVETVAWPPESPDLNPVELVWGNMKNHIRKKGIRRLDDLKVEVIRYWKTLTPEVCSRYISGIRRKMEMVVERGGGNILET